MSKQTSKARNEKARRVSRCLKGVSHEIRLGILLALRKGEKSVGELAKIVECAQPTLSQHLSVMRDREIVKARREGPRILYGVVDPRIYDMLDLLEDLFCQ
jgi:DNA-binding transcriptional ArsR family regulator